MYLPPKFACENQAEILKLIQEYPLATLVSNSEGQIFVSHVPLVAEKSNEELVLIGHLAKGIHTVSFATERISL